RIAMQVEPLRVLPEKQRIFFTGFASGHSNFTFLVYFSPGARFVVHGAMLAVFDRFAAIAESRCPFFKRVNKIKLCFNHLFSSLIDKAHFAVLDETEQPFTHVIGTIIVNEGFVQNLLFTVDGNPAVPGNDVRYTMLVEFHCAKSLQMVRSNIPVASRPKEWASDKNERV
ncbi:MAG TPA: hypothetical protein PKG67_01725, partial [Turneriella sp.]|nr:hypothetical protein [Turneriella sp.]